MEAMMGKLPETLWLNSNECHVYESGVPMKKKQNPRSRPEQIA
jgi:hypothetical protein